MKPKNFYDVTFSFFEMWFIEAGLWSKIDRVSLDPDYELANLYSCRPSDTDGEQMNTANYKVLCFEWSLLSEKDFLLIKGLVLKSFCQQIKQINSEMEEVLRL